MRVDTICMFLRDFNYCDVVFTEEVLEEMRWERWEMMLWSFLVVLEFRGE